MAAGIQAGIGSVVAGSPFAIAQSIAMGAAVPVGVVAAGGIVAAAIAIQAIRIRGGSAENISLDKVFPHLIIITWGMLLHLVLLQEALVSDLEAKIMIIKIVLLPSALLHKIIEHTVFEFVPRAPFANLRSSGHMRL
jgi:hypothetical protein